MDNKNFIYNLIAQEHSIGLDVQQKEALQSWLKLSDENISEYNSIVKLLTYTDRLGAMRRINTDRDLKLVKKKLKPRINTNKLLLNFQRAAAILILPLLIYTAWTIVGSQNTDKKNIVMKSSETAFGVRNQIFLSDGTKVWMNSGSKLTYPDNFDGDTREVKLVGEAYFQVKSDNVHPFYVDLNGYKVKATGTRFNISNYPDDNEISTYLEHGKVSFFAGSNEKTEKLIPLNQNEIIILNKSQKQYKIQHVDGYKYLGWIDGLLIFKNDGISDVAVRLGRWFNAEIVFDGELSKSGYFFTATFKQESLEEALELLAYSSPIKYKIIPGTQLDDSSFSKRKVIISKK